MNYFFRSPVCFSLYLNEKAKGVEVITNAQFSLNYRELVVSTACHVDRTEVMETCCRHRTGITNRRFIFWCCLRL